jgi:hypothetical protein
VRRLLPLCLALGLFGCVGEEPPPGEPALEVGTGTWRFEALEDGQRVDMVRGAQGGWHVWVALRLSNVDAMDEGLLELSVGPADESGLPLETSAEVRFNPPDSQGRKTVLGWLGIVRDPACAVGNLLRVEATMTLPDGTVLEDEVMIEAGAGADPPDACVPS